MTFRHVLLTLGCAATLLVPPSTRTLTTPATCSVVWGASASWNWQRWAPPGATRHALPGTIPRARTRVIRQ